METHFCPIHFFFLSPEFFYEHSERFPAFLCLVGISRIMNTKKNSKFEREVKSNGNTRLPHTNLYFYEANVKIMHLNEV